MVSVFIGQHTISTSFRNVLKNAKTEAILFFFKKKLDFIKPVRKCESSGQDMTAEFGIQYYLLFSEPGAKF